MTDDELRSLVRSAVARHLGTPAGSPSATASVRPAAAASSMAAGLRAALPHPSHHLYLTVVNAGDACVIEPAVTCDHCGYCRSHGH